MNSDISIRRCRIETAAYVKKILPSEVWPMHNRMHYFMKYYLKDRMKIDYSGVRASIFVYLVNVYKLMLQASTMHGALTTYLLTHNYETSPMV